MESEQGVQAEVRTGTQSEARTGTQAEAQTGTQAEARTGTQAQLQTGAQADAALTDVQRMDAAVTDMQKQAVLDRLTVIRQNIAAACAETGRQPDTVTLMAVTKTVAPALINTAVDAGVRVLGENRVQEYLSKRAYYRSDAEVQFIGHLQTNKVRQIVGSVTLIHSVDSLHLAQAIDKSAERHGIVMPVLLEVNIGAEASKSGVSPAELPALLTAVQALPHTEVRGLMTIPPPEPDGAKQDAVFERMAALYREMQQYAPLSVLSMGMSGDYAAAVRHGSTLVRIGSALFGARHYPQK